MDNIRLDRRIHLGRYEIRRHCTFEERTFRALAIVAPRAKDYISL
jgi:hypothetical protein